MLILSNDVLKMFSKYLSGNVNMAQFRDYMAGLRVDKYRMLADADRLFLNEFEGRFAEFSDFGGDEALLKASLVSYVQAEVSSIPSAYVWSFPYKRTFLGFFDTKEEAQKAYKEAVDNIPDEL